MQHYNSKSNEELQTLIPDKSPLAIYKKAYSLGIRKNKNIEKLNRSKARLQEKNPNWKGGKMQDAKGYVLVKCPQHHRAEKNGYVLEHVLVFERETGIIIPNGCCIHHLNGIKNDNRIENLCMMTHGAHTVMHHTGTKRKPETGSKISERKRKHE